ncbi:glycosyltransferase family 4 protein [Nonomuraea cavernae]|uniref:Glycosyl hydrolase n=1 Tax=Nonomuraea cavernae TaxID=2045107 RepID=A0A917Z0F3_9ACTN|nr:glycosyltransferase family 4 protein [Nonomuraea cavernae]MCA2185826.1 glycosyltransferase family 4 protein [Nonomuraea cavernae]GGO69491.1 glycosyl hydrolase [Nonomuraea cavernae]
MNIAVVNWRDPWHPAAGGAETYAWEMARRFAASGHRVCFVTARGPGQPAKDKRDGVRIARMGGPFTVYPLVLGWLLLRRSLFDVVLDCQNGIPFFTPWVLPRRVRIFCVVHHVHDRQFEVHLPRWLAAVGRFLEGPVSRWTYRGQVSVAVSPSTVNAMRERLGWRGPIHIVPNGVSINGSRNIGRSGVPRLVCVGRLVAHKRVDLLLDAVGELRKRWPGLTVDVIGRGPEEDRLRARLPEGVTMHGYLSEDDKERLIASAWLQVSTSQGEGWGLCVLEAAALGVPTVAFDVDGLRDAVRHGRTGWLLPEGTDLAKGIAAALEELEEAAPADPYGDRSRQWAARFCWDRSAERMARLMRGHAVEPVWEES